MNTAKAFINATAKGMKKHWPKIAVGAGSAFLLIGGYLLGREVPKYKEEVAAKEAENGKLPKKEKAKIIAKHFAAPTCAIAGGALFVTASVCENSRRAKIGATACAISELTSSNLIDYKEAAKEILGEEKEKEIEEKVAKKKIEKAGPMPDVVLPEGEYWCQDAIWGGERWITSLNELKAIQNRIRGDLLEMGEDEYITLNDMYGMFRNRHMIKNDNAEALNHIGWINDDKYSHAKPDLNIGSLLTDDGTLILTIAPNALLVDPDYFEMTNFR